MEIILLANVLFFYDESRASTEVLDSNSNCIYWYWDDEREKLNPCINIPDNAKPIFIED